MMETDEEFELLQLTPPTPPQPSPPAPRRQRSSNNGAEKSERRQILVGRRRPANPCDLSDVKDMETDSGHPREVRGLGKGRRRYSEPDEEEVITRKYTDPRGRHRVKAEPLDCGADDCTPTSSELGLLNALSLLPEDLKADSGVGGLRPEAVYLVGVRDMNTAQVFDFLCQAGPRGCQPPVPLWLEWIDDNSCNAVFASWRSALTTLVKLGGLGEGPADDLDVEVRVNDGNRCLRCAAMPGLLARFALATDRKNKNANWSSEFYKRHGNPNYDNMPGVISRTYRHRVNSRRCALEMRQIAENGSAAVVAAAAAAAASATRPDSTRRRRRGKNVEEVDVKPDTASPPPQKRSRLHDYSPTRTLSYSPRGSSDLRHSLRKMRAAPDSDDARTSVSPDSRRVVFVVKSSPPPEPVLSSSMYRVRRQYLESRGGSSRIGGGKEARPDHRPDASRLSSVVQMVQRPPHQPQQAAPKSVVLPSRPRRPVSPSTSFSDSSSSGSSTTSSTSRSGSSSSSSSSSGSSSSSSSSGSESGSSTDSDEEASVGGAPAEWEVRTGGKVASASANGAVKKVR